MERLLLSWPCCKTKAAPRYALIIAFALLIAVGTTWAFATPTQAALVCVNDTAGPNDEPGQKDLTRLCVDEANTPTSIEVTWNWDEISVSGANTLDACSLYDTDGDGYVNYSLCVTTTDGSTDTTTLYSCGWHSL
jgi:hypothetical protein